MVEVADISELTDESIAAKTTIDGDSSPIYRVRADEAGNHVLGARRKEQSAWGVKKQPLAWVWRLYMVAREYCPWRSGNDSVADSIQERLRCVARGGQDTTYFDHRKQSPSER